jgi:MFS family permease
MGGADVVPDRQQGCAAVLRRRRRSHDPLGLSYGPQAALYAEMFPAKVRYSGVSIGYALGAILGGAFAPMIAQWIIASTGQSWRIGVYIAVLSLISLIVVSTVKDLQGVDLNVRDTGS